MKKLNHNELMNYVGEHVYVIDVCNDTISIALLVNDLDEMFHDKYGMIGYKQIKKNKR